MGNARFTYLIETEYDYVKQFTEMVDNAIPNTLIGFIIDINPIQT